MTGLEALAPTQKDLIVALPYRVGLWVSKSDLTGGAESSAQELQALSNILHAFSEDVFGSALVQHVMHETLARKDLWPAWAVDLESVPRECAAAYEALREHFEEKEVKVYALRLMEIAEAVALAFREAPQAGGAGAMASVYLQYLKAFIGARIQKRPLRFYQPAGL